MQETWKFTEQTRKKILADISDYTPYEIAAQSAGVSERGFYKWIAQGKSDLSSGLVTLYSKFVQDLSEVLKVRNKENITKIVNGEKSWDANAWTLEHHPSLRKYYAKNAMEIEKLQTDINELKELLENKAANKTTFTVSTENT